MDKLIIIGISSTAKSICAFIKKYSLYDVIGFAVNKEYKTTDSFCGLPVFAIEELDAVIDKQKDYLFVAIQWNKLNADRKKLYLSLKGQEYKFANLISPNSIINGKIIGENCWIADMVVVDFNSTIEDDTFVKVGAYIGPNTTISSHCFIGAKSTIAGGVLIGEQCFIGLSAVVFDCVTIGGKCIVGAATVLKRNLKDCSVYKISSDNFVTKTYAEDIIESKLMFQKNVR